MIAAGPTLLGLVAWDYRPAYHPPGIWFSRTPEKYRDDSQHYDVCTVVAADAARPGVLQVEKWQGKGPPVLTEVHL